MRRSSLAFVVLSAAAVPGFASVVSTTGQMQFIPPPPSVLVGALSTPAPLMHVFEEVQNSSHSGRVDVLFPLLGVTYHSGFTAPGGYFGPVSSHFIHSDPHSSSPQTNRVGRVTFADPIVAVIFEAGLLDQTDSMLGLGSVAYPAGTVNRGFTFAFSGNDRFRLLSPWTIEFTLGQALDQARVLTTPAPGGAAAALGLGLIVTLRRRRLA